MEQVKLLFSGDFAPLVPVEEINNNHFNEIEEILNSVDLHITNLECPLTDSIESIEKSGPHLKADTLNVKLLKLAEVNIACLANNHIFDFGIAGITDTIENCKIDNIETIGIVSRPDNKDPWIVKEIKGIKIGLINYCEQEFSVRDKGLLGAKGFDPVDAYYDIREIKTQVDRLIVIYHGGNEYYPLPRPGLKKDFHFLADIGADAVIGHHTHVCSGYEIYKGKPLIYSLGNFFFPLSGEKFEWHCGMLCSLKLGKNIEVTFHHFLQCYNNLKIQLLSESDAKSKNKLISNLSNIIINDDELVKYWNEFTITKGTGISNMICYSSRIQRFMVKLPVFPKIFRYSKRNRIILNIVRCQSLLELLINSLKVKNDYRNS